MAEDGRHRQKSVSFAAGGAHSAQLAEGQPPDTLRATVTPTAYTVLHQATVREGKDASSKKVGNLKKGTVIEVVGQSRNSDGLEVLRTTTPLAGWLKIFTSKNVQLVERQTGSPPPPQTRPPLARILAGFGAMRPLAA